MFRRFIVALVVVAGLAVAGLWFSQRGKSGQSGEHDAVQWPFEKSELQSLMGRVIAEQRDRIASIDDAAGRDRATRFLEYYERRRQAAAS